MAEDTDDLSSPIWGGKPQIKPSISNSHLKRKRVVSLDNENESETPPWVSHHLEKVLEDMGPISTGRKQEIDEASMNSWTYTAHQHSSETALMTAALGVARTSTEKLEALSQSHTTLYEAAKARFATDPLKKSLETHEKMVDRISRFLKQNPSVISDIQARGVNLGAESREALNSAERALDEIHETNCKLASELDDHRSAIKKHDELVHHLESRLKSAEARRQASEASRQKADAERRRLTRLLTDKQKVVSSLEKLNTTLVHQLSHEHARIEDIEQRGRLLEESTTQQSLQCQLLNKQLTEQHETSLKQEAEIADRDRVIEAQSQKIRDLDSLLVGKTSLLKKRDACVPGFRSEATYGTSKIRAVQVREVDYTSPETSTASLVAEHRSLRPAKGSLRTDHESLGAMPNCTHTQKASAEASNRSLKAQNSTAEPSVQPFGVQSCTSKPSICPAGGSYSTLNTATSLICYSWSDLAISDTLYRSQTDLALLKCNFKRIAEKCSGITFASSRRSPNCIIEGLVSPLESPSKDHITSMFVRLHCRPSQLQVADIYTFDQGLPSMHPLERQGALSFLFMILQIMAERFQPSTNFLLFILHTIEVLLAWVEQETKAYVSVRNVFNLIKSNIPESEQLIDALKYTISMRLAGECNFTLLEAFATQADSSLAGEGYTYIRKDTSLIICSPTQQMIKVEAAYCQVQTYDKNDPTARWTLGPRWRLALNEHPVLGRFRSCWWSDSQLNDLLDPYIDRSVRGELFDSPSDPSPLLISM